MQENDNLDFYEWGNYEEMNGQFLFLRGIILMPLESCGNNFYRIAFKIPITISFFAVEIHYDYKTLASINIAL